MPASKLAHLQLPDGPERWNTVLPVLAELKEKAKKLGLWNLFLSKAHYPQFGVPLSNLEVSHQHACFDAFMPFLTLTLYIKVRCHG